uniref:Uncharacterized protein n=1 Tax=Triticum urartu TaxID=4572 RepID=A0A8R7R3M9_TRIUA
MRKTSLHSRAATRAARRTKDGWHRACAVYMVCRRGGMVQGCLFCDVYMYITSLRLTEGLNAYWVSCYTFNLGERFLFYFPLLIMLTMRILIFILIMLTMRTTVISVLLLEGVGIIQIIVFLDCLRPVPQSNVAANKVICILFCYQC